MHLQPKKDQLRARALHDGICERCGWNAHIRDHDSWRDTVSSFIRRLNMSGMLINLIVQIIAGAVGGNAAGAGLKDLSLGTLGNTIAGAIGGGVGGQILQAIIPAIAGAAGGVDIGGLVGGGVAGAVLTAIVGAVKNKSA
jgi:hypothetical protein